MVFGVVGMIRFDTFYTRVLASSKTDTVGAFTIIIGLAIRHGFTFFTAKLVLLAVVILIFNPLVSHILVRSAHLSGYEEKKIKDDKK